MSDEAWCSPKRLHNEDDDGAARKRPHVEKNAENSTVVSIERNEPAAASWMLRDLDPADGSRSRTIDDIHGTIYLEPVIVEIMDTPHVQRLKDLKQLGLAHHVYINAYHTRFEHSAGVMHLAEKLCDVIIKKQPLLGIGPKDVLCLKIAGLCHDLGHGPFSHVFDGELRRQLKKEGRIDNDDVWKHEEGSLMMFDAMLGHIGLQIDMNNLDGPLRQIGSGVINESFKSFGSGGKVEVLTSRDMVFVKECILAAPLEGQADFIGRNWDMDFLYDVINNRFSGLDVDKMDYYARDQKRALGFGSIDAILIDEAYVAQAECPVVDCFRCQNTGARARAARCAAIPNGSHLMICFPLKLVPKAVGFFKRRFDLHETIYTHKTAKSYEYLVCDALMKANDHFEFRASDGRIARGISGTVRDPTQYIRMTDDILKDIERSTSEKLESAQEVIHRINTRDHYKVVASERLHRERHQELWLMSGTQIKDEILEGFQTEKNQTFADLCILEEDSALPEEAMGAGEEKADQVLDRHDFIVEMRTIHCGRGELNPLIFLRFLKKEDLEGIGSKTATELPVAKEADEYSYICHMPREFLAKSIRVFCRASKADPEQFEKHAQVREYFHRWLEEKTGIAKTGITLSQS